ncbi:hypothetical protein RHGRI_037334 [Rhododendron griersonianum]|uniref:Aminotransferase-like plant mobile domain-containing protein n=1 Tax=Rhododendron griersonianum TaxID=479676 RepID=A0AAV6HS66_9ERIC|nr:hypothetical protein RHGRI_037334 [Rhododendron griersonianum]
MGKWMTMPDMGHLIASTYNCVLVHLSKNQCLTFLPLRSKPLPSMRRKVIAIGFVDGGHFVQVFLKNGSPMPPIACNWTIFRDQVAKNWGVPYAAAIKKFNEIIGNDVATKEDMEEHEEIITEGPGDRSLLRFQEFHRSHAIWKNNGDRPLDCKPVVVRRSEANLKKLKPPEELVAQCIRQAGFGGLLDMPFISIDLALVTALLERWRPETHTFHFLTGEWTVTLQDVEVLLGLWAWERFPYLAPGLLGKRFRPTGSPLGARWHDNFHNPDLAAHVLGAYRHFFDLQKPDEVIWRPYTDELIESLPPICRAGRAIWMAKVPLICFPFVQNHMPHRVMRQFGFRQTIPDACDCTQPPHGKDFKSGAKNYSVKYRAQVSMWNNRLHHVVPHGDVDLPDSVAYPDNDPYVLWYNRITIRYYGLFERLRTMDPIDLDVVRNIGDKGVACLGNLEKWLRKRPPIKPIAEQQNGRNDEDQHADLVEPQNVASGTEQGQPDATPVTRTEPTGTGSVQDGSGSLHEGGGTGSCSLLTLLRSVEGYPLTLMLEDSPSSMHVIHSPVSQTWFDMADLASADTTLIEGEAEPVVEGVLAGEGCGVLMQGHSQTLAVQERVEASVVEEEQDEIQEPDPTPLVQRPRRSEHVLFESIEWASKLAGPIIYRTCDIVTLLVTPTFPYRAELRYSEHKK